MKNKLIAMAFMLLMNHMVYSQTGNYLNDGGFEQAGDCGNDFSSGCTSNFDNSCTPTPGDCQDLGNDWQSYFDKCPGGINTVNRKMQFWRDGSIISNACEWCAVHASDWQVEPFFVLAGPAGLSGTGFNCFDGNGCVGSNLYAMFQQGMKQSIINNGAYIVSGWVLQANSGSNSTHNMHFIFSPNQANYDNGDCPSNWSSLSSSYVTINHVTGGQSIDFSVGQSDLLNWTYVEAPLQFGTSGSTTGQSLNWFNLATDMNATVASGTVNTDYDGSYFAFDDFYISDAVCYCPLIRLVQNQTFQAPAIVRAQEFIRAGSNVGLFGPSGLSTGPVIISSGGTGKTIFRAGNFISLEPGFEAQPGAVFETQLQGCYDNSNDPTLITAATAFSPDCDGFEDEFCFITQDASGFWLDVYDEGGNEIGPISGQIPFNPVTGQNEVCLDIPFFTPGTNDYVYFLNLTGCNGAITPIQNTFQAQNVVVGCKKILNTPQKLLRSIDNDITTTSNPQKNVEIYPSPTCGNITVSVSSYAPTDRIQISGLDGKLVKQYDCAGISSEYNISALNDGIYIVSYISNNSCSTQKITKICE